jgi:hypothetical protein
LKITIVEPTQAMLESIAARMCTDDVDELVAQGLTPLPTLLQGWQMSREIYVACWDGQPQAAFGVADYTQDGNYGVPWMLSTGPRGSVVREFLAVSRKYIEAWSPMYLAMFNLVDHRHIRAQRWLMYLGFEPYTAHEVDGHTFIEFGRVPCVDR